MTTDQEIQAVIDEGVAAMEALKAQLTEDRMTPAFCRMVIFSVEENARRSVEELESLVNALRRAVETGETWRCVALFTALGIAASAAKTWGQKLASVTKLYGGIAAEEGKAPGFALPPEEEARISELTKEFRDRQKPKATQSAEQISQEQFAADLAALNAPSTGD